MITFEQRTRRTTVTKDEHGINYVSHTETWEELCPLCYKPMPVQHETEEWNLSRGEWVHSLFGLPSGDCQDCEYAFVEGFDGTYHIDLKETA